MNNLITSRADSFEYIGWRYYNQIKKKAMEQEFSWSGLVLNLSIAFFIVIASAFCLSCVQKSISLVEAAAEIEPTKIYHLEQNLPIEFFGQERLEKIRTFNSLT